MKQVAVRIAQKSDYQEIRNFIALEWNPDHVFVKNRDLFMWQHLGSSTNLLNFLVLEVDGLIEAVLGYIPYRHFGPSSPSNRVFLTLWSALDKPSVPGAGLMLLMRLQKLTSCDFIGAIGISDVALSIFRRLGFEIGLMDHFVVFNAQIEPTVASNVPEPNLTLGDATLRPLSLEADIEILAGVCARYQAPKDADFFMNRYNRHPTYTYMALMVESHNSQCILVVREITLGEAKVARIVDAVGDYAVIAESAKALETFVTQQGHEYIDLYAYGIDADFMIGKGFFQRLPDSPAVIPNYFEPFEKRNVELAVAWKSFGAKGPVVLFRGDSDQDRPNK